MNHHSPSASEPVIMTVAGFDPSSGAGVTADIKTFAAHGCYGVAAITAFTVQNTLGVTGVHPVDASTLMDCTRSLLAECSVRAVKIGMLATRANAEVVSEILQDHPSQPSVLDPVLRSSSGHDLIDTAGLEFVRDHLIRRVSVITPNLHEAAVLASMKVESVEEAKSAARRLVEMGARAVLVTGGHLEKPVDVYCDGSVLQTFIGDRAKPEHVHGAGCTFSSALAANLALGRQTVESIVLAKAFITEAIKKAYPIGGGRIPVNPLYRMQESHRVSDLSTVVP